MMTPPRRHLDIVDPSPRVDFSPRVDSPPVGSLRAPGLLADPLAWDESELLQVGELARDVGKTVRAIHLYEDLGLITPVRRSKGRYRLFAPDAKVRIRWITKLQSLGLSLNDIQALVEQRQTSSSAGRAAAELRQVYADKLTEVRETIERYRKLEVELEASLAFLDACRSACEHDADWNSCPSCERHGSARNDAPELIVGAQFVRDSA